MMLVEETTQETTQEESLAERIANDVIDAYIETDIDPWGGSLLCRNASTGRFKACALGVMEYKRAGGIDHKWNTRKTLEEYGITKGQHIAMFALGFDDGFAGMPFPGYDEERWPYTVGHRVGERVAEAFPSIELECLHGFAALAQEA